VGVKLFLSKEAYTLDQIFIATFQEIACFGNEKWRKNTSKT